jgi:hypothetical protein
MAGKEPGLTQDPPPALAKAGAGRVSGRGGRAGASLLAGILGLIGTSLLVGADHAPPFRDGPPAHYTGGFGEPTCVSCHFEGRLNESPGSLALEGVPEQYEAGKTYPVTVTLSRPGMKIAGFELSVRFESGAQAGKLELLPQDEDSLGITVDRDVQYVHHLRPGTSRVVSDTARWTVRWTAPSNAAPVVFNAAGNAADSDDSQAGDYIFATEARTRPQGR